MIVPFVDLRAQYLSIRRELDATIQAVIDQNAFIGGRYVKAFEEAFAEKCGVAHCIGVGNGTDALYITLRMLGISSGDEVITVANTWISTAESISQTGACPVFIDIDADSYNMDVTKIEGKITDRTRAILPVHLFGQPAQIEAVQGFCGRYGLHLIEDCAQAHFARYQGEKVGTFGIAGTFSFYPGKNLGGYGDGGAVITNDDGLAERVRMFANHGALKKHEHRMEGINSRLDGLQAAILSAKLRYIDDWNQERHRKGLLYNRLLEEIDEVATPTLTEGVDHIFHIYCVRCPQRDALRNYLKEKGIATSIHYPKALPFLKVYSYLGHEPQDFPLASDYQNQLLSLPIYPELRESQIEHVVDQIRVFYAQEDSPET